MVGSEGGGRQAESDPFDGWAPGDVLLTVRFGNQHVRASSYSEDGSVGLETFELIIDRWASEVALAKNELVNLR